MWTRLCAVWGVKGKKKMACDNQNGEEGKKTRIDLGRGLGRVGKKQKNT
jgi:hypothetical protein